MKLCLHIFYIIQKLPEIIDQHHMKLALISHL
jgi:hypothetical protein